MKNFALVEDSDGLRRLASAQREAFSALLPMYSPFLPRFDLLGGFYSCLLFSSCVCLTVAAPSSFVIFFSFVYLTVLFLTFPTRLCINRDNCKKAKGVANINGFIREV